MKPTKILLLAILATTFQLLGCSKDADDAYDDANMSATTINGKWKEKNSGVVIEISGVSSSSNGTAKVRAVGTAFPSGALNGTCMTDVEYHQGGYWDAYNWTYYPGTGWKQTSVVGLAMNNGVTTQFKIGSAIYYRQ